MGSGRYIEALGETYFLPHRIRCNSGWAGHAPHSHSSAGEVRSCWRAAADEKNGTEVWPCGWLYTVPGEDGPAERACTAPTRFTAADGRFECEAGHSHVPAEVCEAERWAYAEDEEEARRLRGLGVDAVAMGGGSI